ncbi:MAG TPA: cation diffusion facilitator family transporter [Acidimicrobiales bacterium]|nr:cation diffusion facilitator family transporter [Acidimicrobiales bacterium]
MEIAGGHDHDHGGDGHHDHDDSGPGHDQDDPGPGHHHGHGRLAGLTGLLGWGHSHDAADRVDAAMKASDHGIRAVRTSLVILAVAAALQAVVVSLSGSVALLGDTLHNLADALTAVPLWIAFSIGRRPPTRRYTYGYGRAEDLAAIVIVTAMAASSVAAAWASVLRLIHPHAVHHVAAVAAAAAVGFLGNEAVAVYRIRTGRAIGSAALVADGLHARTDGLTSLAVLIGAAGVWLGAPVADPIVGLVVTAAILAVLRSAARDVYRRLMDAVDPDLVAGAHGVLGDVEGVLGVADLQVRWLGHQLLAEAALEVNPSLTVVQAHEVAERANHALLHHLPRLTAARIHTDPAPLDGTDHHGLTSHHGRED